MLQARRFGGCPELTRLVDKFGRAFQLHLLGSVLIDPMRDGYRLRLARPGDSEVHVVLLPQVILESSQHLANTIAMFMQDVASELEPQWSPYPP